jgi:hypothetical protein
MANTIVYAMRHKWREELERRVDEMDSRQPFVQAMRSFLAAMEYDDPVLMRSRLNDALEVFKDGTREDIEKRVGWPELARQACRKVKELLKGALCEHFDEIGREIESSLDKMLKSLTGIRDNAVKVLTERGLVVENAVQLDHAIREVEELKSGVLKDWPWSDRELPPVDRKMVAESKAAIKRNEGERVEDLIRRLGGVPTKVD